MYARIKLLHPKHSGTIQPRQHTSYLPLAFIVFVVGLVLVRFTILAYAATPYTGPEAGSVGLTGTMPSKPPTVGATITSPADGQHFNLTPIKVSGTCPQDTLVEIFKNDIFAGSTPCNSGGSFSIEIDLLFGKNILTAQVFDVLNQAGPVSKPVTVYYDYAFAQAAPSNFLNFSGTQMLLYTDAAYRGSFPNQNLNVPVTVIGGTPPFAINVQWGDTGNQLVPRDNNTTFNTAHAYKKPGTYKISLQGTDSKNLVAYLAVAAIINGKPEALAASANVPAGKVLMLWPLFAIVVAILVGFWLGEKREKKLLKVGKPATPAIGTAAQPQPPR